MLTSTGPEYHFFVPGLDQVAYLLNPETDHYPALSRLFSVARPFSVVNSNLHLLARLCDLPIADDSDFPLAAILARQQLQQQFTEGSYWVQAIPVELIADRDRLLLRQAELSSAMKASAQAELAHEILQQFPDFFKQVLLMDESGWLFELQKAAKITTVSRRLANDGPLDQMMPQGEDKSQWHQLMNEIQMLFHMRDSSRLGFNSLWFEHAGRLPEKNHFSSSCLISNDAEIETVGQYCGYDVCPSVDDCLKTGGLDNIIHFQGDLDKAFSEQSFSECESALAALERHCQAMLSALRQRKIRMLNVYPGNALLYRFEKSDLYKFWVRNQPIKKKLENYKSI